ncbi:MAG TPA: ATP-binding cassette domain-containing protein [Gemmatimonadaceae bacterium]|nr:ATP-binding cassette domain-containing protein [Gemmatimonadaceae bacterium]
MSVLLAADCVSKSFTGRRVLAAGTLRAVPGEIRVVLGRNGVGKSTLIKIAAGWIQPDSGCVHYDGRAYLSVRLPALAAQGVFYLPDHDLLSSAFTVRAQLTMFSGRFRGDDPADAADRMDIAALIDRRPHTLSGGERRRAELAAVFCRRPRCLLADEPYRGIAPRDAAALTEAFRQLAAGGCAVVVTGHEVPTLLDAATHVTWCTAGTTYELGAPEVARRHEEFRRGYLGPRAVSMTGSISSTDASGTKNADPSR